MKGHLGLTGILGGGAAVLVSAMPASATATQVTGVQINRTTAGMEVVLQTRGGGDRPQVFTVSRGNTMIADVINTQLRLPDGNGFLQNAPAPGIQSVMVSQLDANSIRIAVTGESGAPNGQLRQANQSMVLNVGAGAAPTAASQPQPGRPAPGPVAQTPPAPTPAAPTPPIPGTPAAPTGPVMVPNPEVLINGNRVPAPSTGVPPLLPRAVAPPVGDIAVATTDPTPDQISLATNEVVPRLVLRDAPVRDVLSLLARAAGYNVAYVDAQGNQQQPGAAAQQPGAAGAAPGAENRISLDIENEPVQNVFNYVLRISGLEANLNNRTIFIGNRLPNSARGTVMRTLRLNQVAVGPALNFLVGLGAETAVSRTRQVASVVAVPVTGIGEGGQTSGINQVQTTQEERIETQRVNFQDSTPILRGLQVIGDERTNSVTLVGTPRSVEIATAQLVQLDIRRRQVAVNVRVIDVNLLNTNNVDGSFGFGVGNFRFFTFDADGPGSGTATYETNLGGVGDDFFASLSASITNGNAKILTDPTLVVQEGQTAEVRLTQEVVVDFQQEREITQQSERVTLEVETEPAGLVLQVRVDRIDDNGFVTLSVAPTVTAVGETIEIDFAGVDPVLIALLSERRLTSGALRLRDGQTLVLSGIIRDQDRVDVRKVPILGDIPILGALFRSSTRRNERQELIVVLTPQILDDSDGSTFGYRYTPTEDTQRFIRDRERSRQPQQ